MQNEVRMRHIILSTVECPATPYFFPRDFINGRFSEKKELLNIKFVFSYSVKLLPEAFFTQ